MRSLGNRDSKVILRLQVASISLTGTSLANWFTELCRVLFSFSLILPGSVDLR